MAWTMAGLPAGTQQTARRAAAPEGRKDSERERADDARPELGEDEERPEEGDVDGGEFPDVQHGTPHDQGTRHAVDAGGTGPNWRVGVARQCVRCCVRAPSGSAGPPHRHPARPAPDGRASPQPR